MQMEKNINHLIGRARPDCRVKPNLYTSKRAFTLIELLVVVLIIGILAAVAIPQYQKAVWKTRMSSMLPILKAIKDAQERYYFANNEYTDDLRQLDIQIAPGDSGGIIFYGSACYNNGTCLDNMTVNDASGWEVVGGIGSDYQGNSTDACFFHVYFDHSAKPGVIECGKERSTHPKCTEICKSLGYE